MKIFLIRHGETTSDVENLYGGSYDDHLTDKGRKQVEELTNKLSSHGIQIIFSSSYIRAIETSDILKHSLNCNIQIIDNIKERNTYGEWSGKNRDKMREANPELAEKIKDYNFTMDGAESYVDFTNRVRHAFEEIVNSKFAKVAVVTHGGPIICLFREVLKFGEFAKGLSDCAVIELEKNNLNFKIVNMDGATLA